MPALPPPVSLVAALSAVLALAGCQRDSLDDRQKDVAEIAVDGVLLAAAAQGDPQLVISWTTEDWSFPSTVAADPSQHEALLRTKFGDRLKPGVVDDYLRRAVPGSPLQRTAPLPLEWLILDQREMDALKATRPGDLVADPAGRAVLSHVGFSRDGQQAIGYIGRRRGQRTGAGGFFLLENQGGTWTIVQTIKLWGA